MCKNGGLQLFMKNFSKLITQLASQFWQLAQKTRFTDFQSHWTSYLSMWGFLKSFLLPSWLPNHHCNCIFNHLFVRFLYGGEIIKSIISQFVYESLFFIHEWCSCFCFHPKNILKTTLHKALSAKTQTMHEKKNHLLAG